MALTPWRRSTFTTSHPPPRRVARAGGKVFRDRFGVPLHVGDWITEGDEAPVRISKLDHADCGITRAFVEGSSGVPSNLEIYWRKVNAPGGSTENSTMAEPVSVPGREASGPPGDLAAFTAAVDEHLSPRLPKDWKTITDSVAGELWLIWILDDRGAEVHFAQYSSGWVFTDGNAAAISTVVAERLMSRLARPASERERGRGK